MARTTRISRRKQIKKIEPNVTTPKSSPSNKENRTPPAVSIPHASTSHNISIDSSESNNKEPLPSFTAIHLSNSALINIASQDEPHSPALSVISDVSCTSVGSAALMRMVPVSNQLNVSIHSPIVGNIVEQYLRDSPQLSSSLILHTSRMHDDMDDAEGGSQENGDAQSEEHSPNKADGKAPPESISDATPPPRRVIRRKRKRVSLNHSFDAESEEHIATSSTSGIATRVRRKRRNMGTFESEIIELGGKSTNVKSTPRQDTTSRDAPSSAESSYSFGSSPFMNNSPNVEEVGTLRKRLIFKSPSTRSQSRNKYHCHQSSSLTLSSGSKKASTSSRGGTSLCQLCGIDKSSDNHSTFCARLRRTMKLSDSVLQSLGTLRMDNLEQCDIPSLRIYELNMKKRKAINIFDVVSDMLLFSEDDNTDADTFKLFVCLDHDLVVGAVIVEQISWAYRTKSSTGSSPSKRPQRDVFEYDSTKRVKAVLGVSRIWVDERYRRSTIASHLVDCARKYTIGGFECGRELIAFTQPTEAGKRFAMRYCEGCGDCPFLVYRVSVGDAGAEKEE